jgi:GNAT superfamily N-acetyltransferase
MNMHIRRAGHPDLEVLTELFDGYRRFYHQTGDSDGGRRFLAARLGAGDSVVFLAEDADGTGLGFTQLYPIFSSVQLRRVWLLNDLYVAEAARRGGVADALMDAAERFAREDGALVLQLQTGSDNLPAQALYRRRGWVQESGYQYYELAL